MRKILTLIIALGILLFHAGTASAQQKVSLSGYIKDAKSGETLIGAIVQIKEAGAAAATNKYGYYSLTVSPGKYTVVLSYMGYTSQTRTIDIQKNTILNAEMAEEGIELKEVTVKSQRADANVSDTKMSKEKLNIEAVKKMPALFGEVDILKTIQLIPGIQTAGEGTTGFFVRGGSADQNLILLDEAPVYNASHFLGFFSVFNSDAIRDVEIYKGGIPAQYGGRLSSLLDIRMKEGNARKFTLSGGLGTISSRLTLEGPIKKDTSSFIISGRRTYADVFLKLSPDSNIRNNSLYFYDINAKLNYTLGKKDKMFLSGYFGRDVFNFSKIFGLDWGNTTGTLRWNHVYSSKVFTNTTLMFSNYDYAFQINAGVQNFRWTSRLQELSLKQDYAWFLNPKNEIHYGFIASGHSFTPGNIDPVNSSSIFKPFRTNKNYALEEALYIGNKQTLSRRLSLEYGLRYSFFHNIGPGTEYQYRDGIIDEKHIFDTLTFSDYHIYKSYGGLEPRISGRFTINDMSSVKASYTRTMQYLHLASLSTSTLPTDLWISSNKYILPQKADQVAMGYFRNFRDNTVETSVEVYYKNMYNQIDFKDNAQLLLNQHIETEIRAGKAWSYGVEFSVKKQVGKTTGWLGYTLSKTQRQIEGINDGRAYSAKYDRRHNLVLVLSHDFNRRLNVSANFTYATGNAVTFPDSRFSFDGQTVPHYSDRNGFRMPDYHRLDLAATLKGKEKVGRKWEGSWNFSVYNAYAAQNAFSIYFRAKKDNAMETEAVKVYLFSIIPSITYNFKF